MRVSAIISLIAVLTLMFALPVHAATETPQPQDSLPLGLAIAVIAGVLVFAYFFSRPSRMTGRKDWPRDE
jgi:hypothetical protein